jgi:hypothetical protein
MQGKGNREQLGSLDRAIKYFYPNRAGVPYVGYKDQA